MTIRVAIHHQTDYRFDQSVEIFPHIIRLKPAAHCRTPIYSYSLKILPKQHFINWQQDPFGNYLARLVFPNPSKRLKIEVEVVIDMVTINPFDFFVDESAKSFPFKYSKQLQKELIPYLEQSESCSELMQWLDDFEKKDNEAIIDFLVRLNQCLQQSITYGIRMEPGVQTCEQTLKRKTGSCRDTAWLLVQILRHLGLAARFVSGYLVQLTSDQKALDGPSGPEQDFTDLHAWCEVFIPGAGWVGLDPTSGLFAGEGHIPLACTPDPVSAAPITGSTDTCKVDFQFSNEVIRVHEDPRVTKPYTDDQWQRIKNLGHTVDQDLQAQDVRLTIGGEPTFVSIDDMEAPEWNTEALGENKLALSKELILKLRDRFAPGGLLHYGQGKWYPGEPLPRWALGCFWRTDQEPLWRDSQWLAKVSQNYGFDLQDAERFINTLMQSLGLDAEHLLPAYEDALYHLWLEQREPINVDLTRSNLKDSLERQALSKRLSQGLHKPVGFVLPLAWDWYANQWISGLWKFRCGQLFLVPGDSPMGLRLPLDALPEPEHHYDVYLPEQDLVSSKSSLPPAGKVIEQLRLTSTHAEALIHTKNTNKEKASKHTWANTIRTALCIEPRDGKLFIFLPPSSYLEHYVALIEALENTAKACKLPIVIEGYEPPKDSRIQKLLVTPDPGVIEVNIHPAASWGELNERLHVLYDTARQCRLGTEKFMLDGRHSGTGGGNHVTFGAKSPIDSPFLRRPDLLRSLITYWQHHPGLSYLFSGAFIGPTSQAPRVDEGRDEMLYELDIAFSHMPTGQVQQPWLVDRLLRNLLVDITGNTHRSEFCIDKLFSPGNLGGRQGLVEFRGFEMPPHPQMAMVQVLLLQSLIAHFWRRPYQKQLIRWGTLLHDRFMLPHFIWADIKDVVNDLNEAGFAFELDWLAPFEEFRFPHYGRTQLDDIEISLRWAIEPWHVLGEEVSQAGTARYVDSSVERLQVKLKGLIPERYCLTCNGHPVYLNKTGTHGEYVAGIRYRAWQPPSALHPTIGVHTPLVFDLIDTWNAKSIGGCSYHVTHPGGRNYVTYPVNAYEAEARRVNRYWQGCHSPGRLLEQGNQTVVREFFEHKHEPKNSYVPNQGPIPEYPYTLDLRQVDMG